MLVALLQIASPDDEAPADRRERVDAAVRAESALADADLLVLPEMWSPGCFNFDAYEGDAMPLDGPVFELAAGWARLHDMRVHAGSFVERDGDDLHNTSILVAPDGTLEASYRKVHLFSYDSREAELLSPGNAAVTRGNLGITTCYDLRFPELYRSLVDAGADTFVVCSAWPQARAEHWKLFTTARAVEQQATVIACNAVGYQGGAEMAGHSRIVNADGSLVVEAGNEEGFNYAEVDESYPARARAKFPALADRRWRG